MSERKWNERAGQGEHVFHGGWDYQPKCFNVEAQHPAVVSVVKTEHYKRHTVKLEGKVRGLAKERHNKILQLGTLDI